MLCEQFELMTWILSTVFAGLTLLQPEMAFISDHLQQGAAAIDGAFILYRTPVLALDQAIQVDV
jgi:hypothetical protein